jgi:hypothetical protein
MPIFDQLKNNKGTVSSALGKKLGQEVLNGNIEILNEAIDLCCYSLKNKKEKNIRSGAAKIVEIVVLEKPDLVANALEKLVPALTADEPQTRWMIFRAFGLCAALNPEVAKKALPFASKCIREKKDGQLCLVSSADLYLGDYGALSVQNTNEVFPILLESTDNVILNEHDWLLEAFSNIAKHLNKEEKKVVLEFAENYRNFPRKTTQVRANKLIALCE